MCCDHFGYSKGEGILFAFAGDETTALESFPSLKYYKPGSFTWIKKQENIPEGFDLSQLALAFVSQEVDAGNAPNVIHPPESKRAFFPRWSILRTRGRMARRGTVYLYFSKGQAGKECPYRAQLHFRMVTSLSATAR